MTSSRKRQRPVTCDPIRRRWLGAGIALALLWPWPVPAQEDRIHVYAAASLSEVVTELGEDFGRQGTLTPVIVLASSGTLARQIDNGAPADVYLSANPDWVDHLEEQERLQPGSRIDLVGNRLALIAPAGIEEDFGTGSDQPTDILARLPADGRVAVADPAHAPAGRYARQGLEALGLWDAVEPRLARMPDVRATLALVGRGEADLGIVYTTDAPLTEDVAIVGLFPADSHAPILYVAAAVADGNVEAATAFLDFLTSDEAQAVFARFGFVPLH